MILLETNPTVVKKQRIRRIIKEEGLCLVCAQKGKTLYKGENEGKGGRKDKKCWKTRRKTKYHPLTKCKNCGILNSNKEDK